MTGPGAPAATGAAPAGTATVRQTVIVAATSAIMRVAVRRTGAGNGMQLSFRQPPTGLADGFGTEDPYR
ncbi:hypothetical protein GCM10027280_32520 [Micromonospora polyrhachis]